MNAAAAGSLTFMVGADSGETFNKAEAVLGAMGAKIVHCGAVVSCLQAVIQAVTAVTTGHRGRGQDLQQHAPGGE